MGLAGRELYLADFTCCQSRGLSRNMAEVSVNSFRTSLYLGCIVGIINVALLKTPSESLIDVVMQVNEFENSYASNHDANKRLRASCFPSPVSHI